MLSLFSKKKIARVVFLSLSDSRLSSAKSLQWWSWSDFVRFLGFLLCVAADMSFISFLFSSAKGTFHFCKFRMDNNSLCNRCTHEHDARNASNRRRWLESIAKNLIFDFPYDVLIIAHVQVFNIPITIVSTFETYQLYVDEYHITLICLIKVEKTLKLPKK